MLKGHVLWHFLTFCSVSLFGFVRRNAMEMTIAEIIPTKKTVSPRLVRLVTSAVTTVVNASLNDGSATSTKIAPTGLTNQRKLVPTVIESVTQILSSDVKTKSVCHCGMFATLSMTVATTLTSLKPIAGIFGVTRISSSARQVDTVSPCIKDATMVLPTVLTSPTRKIAVCCGYF